MPDFQELIVGKVVGKTGPQGPQGIPGRNGDAGPAGPAGPAGADGKSPYQLAVEGGWSGTETDFNAALANVGDIGALLDSINGEVV